MREMKASGISWLGELPSNWELRKIKYCLQERVEKNNPVRTTEILSLTAKQGVIPYDQKEGGGNKPKEDVSAYRLAYPGDIVMNSMNILSGSVGLSQYFGCVSPVYYMLRPWNAKEDVRYYNYIFQTTMFQRSLFGLGNGILIKESGNGKLNTIRMRIPMDKFGGLFIPVAPTGEQHRIADFLDAKCAEIDVLTTDIQTQIDTLEQYNQKLELMYTKPATTFNPDLTRKYGQNIFSAMEEVWASDKERIDVVIFLNGLAIIAFELKCNAAGQSYQDAIYQFRTDRSPKTRLFMFKAGTLVNFAMDLEEVYMTTKLAGDATFFLPFNMGNGEGVTAGAGNPAFEDKYSVSYMWEDILTKDTILDLISKFIFVETKEKVDDKTGKIKRSENLIFPRYHQLDVIRKVLADVRENRTAQNYLIQHSAGLMKNINGRLCNAFS